MITSLTLTDFRSYAGARLEMTSGPVVLHGPNGAGKTNLLEAISRRAAYLALLAEFPQALGMVARLMRVAPSQTSSCLIRRLKAG